MMMMMMDNGDGDGDGDGGDDDGDCGDVDDDDGRRNEVIMVQFVFQFHRGEATIFPFEKKTTIRVLNGGNLNLSN